MDDVAAFKTAFDKWKIEAERYHTWHRTETDEFAIELRPRYEAELEQVRAELAGICCSSLLSVAKGHGVRFLSINLSDLITFESIRHGPDPITWYLVDLLGIAYGAGNTSQHQVRWGKHPLLRDTEIGVYDLRGDEPVRLDILPFTIMTTSLRRCAKKIADDEDVLKQLERCRY